MSYRVLASHSTCRIHSRHVPAMRLLHQYIKLALPAWLVRTILCILLGQTILSTPFETWERMPN
eukprot:5387651-Lingulodinium_polyedra.AAC.1